MCVSSLRQIFSDPRILKVLHGADRRSLRLIEQRFGVAVVERS